MNLIIFKDTAPRGNSLIGQNELCPTLRPNLQTNLSSRQVDTSWQNIDRLQSQPKLLRFLQQKACWYIIMRCPEILDFFNSKLHQEPHLLRGDYFISFHFTDCEVKEVLSKVHDLAAITMTTNHNRDPGTNNCLQNWTRQISSVHVECLRAHPL